MSALELDKHPEGQRSEVVAKESQSAVAALEDKIVQRATAAVLNAIYEEDFLGFSYGFRPGRGAHDALDALVVALKSRKVNFIFDADIRQPARDRRPKPAPHGPAHGYSP
jgi:hypothetical protein